MIISTSHKFVYCAVPKVASRSLRSLLEPFADVELMGSMFKRYRNDAGEIPIRNPKRIRKRLQKAGHDPASFFWFGFMRNPWDRAVSRYHFERERVGDPNFENYSLRHREYHESMIDLTWEQYLFEAPYFPQSEWLRDDSGILIDRAYRMEDFDSSLAELGDVLGCKLSKPSFVGATVRDRDYRSYFENERQVEAVARYYAEDILLGGYRFDGDYGESFDLKRLTSCGSRA